MIEFLKVKDVKDPCRKIGDAGIDFFIPSFSKELQQELQEKKDYEVAIQLFLRLQKNLVDIKPQLSEEGRKEVDTLLNLIDDSEVCRARYDILHQVGVEIILKEKSKRG